MGYRSRSHEELVKAISLIMILLLFASVCYGMSALGMR